MQNPDPPLSGSGVGAPRGVSVVGLDIGGSSTRAVLGTVDGPVTVEADGPSANVAAVGSGPAGRALAAVLADLGDLGGVAAVCAGSAGADTSTELDEVQRLYTDHDLWARVF